MAQIGKVFKVIYIPYDLVKQGVRFGGDEKLVAGLGG